MILKKAVLKMDDDTDEFMVMQALACTPDVMGMHPKKSDTDMLELVDAEYDGKYLCTLIDECGGDGYEEASWDNHMADL